jgi:YbbR domain-containing protein
MIAGDSEVLNNVDSIVLDTIYLQDLQGQQTLKYTVSVPEGTELVGETREVTVSITVDGVSEQRFTTSNLSCRAVTVSSALMNLPRCTPTAPYIPLALWVTCLSRRGVCSTRCVPSTVPE